MDEKRGEEFDGAEADDFFGDDEQDQEELGGQPRTMAERYSSTYVHEAQTTINITASHCRRCRCVRLVSSFPGIGLVKRIGGDATYAYLGVLTMYRDLVKYRLSMPHSYTYSVYCVRPHAFISDRYHSPPQRNGGEVGARVTC